MTITRLVKTFTQLFSSSVFNSQFCEGNIPTIGRRSIDVEEDFDVLHSIIYYLYTGQITFDDDPSSSVSTPKVTDPGIIYSAADRFLLPELKDKAYNFFISTLDVKNITSRVFDEQLTLHTEVDEVCSSFFKIRVGDIMETSEYKEFFAELENCPCERRAWVNSKFRALVEGQLRGLKRKQYDWDD